MSGAAAEAGGSRLDRLIKLIDTGSTPDARREAAKQIGELAASHAGQLPNLLRRIRAHLRSKKMGHSRGGVGDDERNRLAADAPDDCVAGS